MRHSRSSSSSASRSPPPCSASRALIENDYVFFAGYTVLQFIVLATAWNILGGYCGYVNFGSAAFFAIGAYTSVASFFHKTSIPSAAIPLPIRADRASAASCPASSGSAWAI